MFTVSNSNPDFVSPGNLVNAGNTIAGAAKPFNAMFGANLMLYFLASGNDSYRVSGEERVR